MKDYKTIYGSLVTGDWPNTVPKNASGPSASDGTPFTAEFIQDLWGHRIDLMVKAGMTPNGIAESNGASQTTVAMQRVIRGPGEYVLSALNAATLAVRRFIPLTGQVIAISSYPDLVSMVYCGDSANATAAAFYKTSDSGGLTRSTSGAYMVLPDARGLFFRGMGSNAKIFAANGAAYSGGSEIAALMNDMMQAHEHTCNYFSALYAHGTGTMNPHAIPTTEINNATFASNGTIVAQGSNGTPRVGFETRGASIAAQICITY